MSEQSDHKRKIDDVQFHSEPVREIMSQTPGFLLRSGTSLVFLFIMIVIVLSWMIKYPDVISGSVVITTEEPAIKLVSKTSGQLVKLHVKDGAFVAKGTHIAEIENPLNEQAILHLREVIGHIENMLDSTQVIPINFSDSILVFGEFQNDYNQFVQTLLEYNELISNPYNQNKISSLKQQITNYESLTVISKRQLKLGKHALKNARAKYQAQKRLYKDSVISTMEFIEQEALYTQSKQSVENLNKTLVQNSITLTDYQNQYNELTYTLSEKQRTLKEQLKAFVKSVENYINSWQMNYVFKAPFSGEVSYLSNWTENQFISSGVELFAILPENEVYVAYIQIPAQGFGKIKQGQRVNIKLDNYPSHEYGILKGEVIELSELPQTTDNGQSFYMVKVSLPKELISTYKRNIEYTPEMLGVADIVTDDLRLIERVFNQFKKVFDR